MLCSDDQLSSGVIRSKTVTVERDLIGDFDVYAAYVRSRAGMANL